MLKVRLTEELSNALKNTRNDKNVKAADVATQIGKSLAFISKLENNMAEYVELDIIIEIFQFLIGKDENLEDYINPLLEKASMELTPEEIKKQQWMRVFDMVYRRIPIPVSLISFLNDELEKLNLTPEQVVLEMNKNQELDDRNLSNKNKNSLIFSKNKEDSYAYIIFDLKENLLANILDGKVRTINYITMDGIVRTLNKINGLSVDDATHKATSILNSHKFYSLYEKKKLLRINKRQEDIDAVLTDFDKANRETVNSIMKNIMMLSEWNIDYANKKLKNLDDSFNTDPPFIMAIIGSEFFKLKNVKKENKKQFISELNKLIDKFSNITPDPEEDFEIY
ncbi:hypothetical protein E4K67_19885 [Desulfosporosinus fructosivorans]|uniref:Uncharacterized protein n=1 Tax=Desulfosporosinus fructosivorans TaxID=2018669 RepID=A0A4Z0R4Y3_9FIRM|nr:hypothetical protein [Desulfosporosinus fructosivorans]TGE36686.1 hypothetical protein E4K67_19885 [Desulfosporosinus fructosivorans]